MLATLAIVWFVLLVGTTQVETGTCLSVVSSLSSKLELFPYQKVGVQKLLKGQRILLADEMGLGKTVQCIEAINVFYNQNKKAPPPNEAKILIICPKSVMSVWQQELEKWLCVKGIQVHVGTSKRFPTQLLSNSSDVTTTNTNDGFILLVNYDICQKHKHLLQSTRYTFLICDEAHYLKSIDSQRTRAIFGHGRQDKGIQSRWLWLLTGTPIMNRPIELYPLLNAIDSTKWNSLEQYQETYCNPQYRDWGWDYNGASNLGDLSRKLQPIMIRRFKANVLKDLPPKIKSVIPLQGSQQEEQQDAQQLVKEFQQETGYDDVSLRKQNSKDGALAQLSGDQQIELCGILGLDQLQMKAMGTNKILGLVTRVRIKTAMRKVPLAIELLRDAMLSHKVVVFCHHRCVMFKLMEEFKQQAVCVMGGMDSEERAMAVSEFQTNPDIKLFVGSIRAAGVGITLTASSHVVFLELDWSPAVMEQAEDRCHRVSQQDCVQVQYYVFKDTIDEYLAKTLVSKQSSIARALDSERRRVKSPDSASGPYALDFGKHRGLQLDDVPKDYIGFLVDKEVWRTRPVLWRELFSRGLVSENPPRLPKRPVTNHGTLENTSSDKDDHAAPVDFTFDFGKHKGVKWERAPAGYRQWVLREKVWKNRPELQEALSQAGLLKSF